MHAQPGTAPGDAARTAAASRARYRHGLYSADVVAPTEDAADYEDFRAERIAELAPGTPHERDLAEEIVQFKWQLRRVLASHAGVYTAIEHRMPAEVRDSRQHRLGWCLLQDVVNGNSLDKLSRHAQRLSNAIHKTLKELRTYQEARRRGLDAVGGPGSSGGCGGGVRAPKMGTGGSTDGGNGEFVDRGEADRSLRSRVGRVDLLERYPLGEWIPLQGMRHGRRGAPPIAVRGSATAGESCAG